MVAKLARKNAMSCGVTFLPPPIRIFFFFDRGFAIPLPAQGAATLFSPEARISPFTILPLLSLPSQAKFKDFAGFPLPLPGLPAGRRRS